MDTYEEKYNEALERAKDYFKANQRTGELEENDMLSDIFPELKDSEDETIRKRLIQYFSTFRLGTFAGIEPKKIIAWLEKQKEFVSADFDDVWETADCNELTAPLEKYSKDAIKEMCHAWYDKGIELERRNWLVKQGEQKPEWSEEDEAKLKSVLFHIEDVENKDVISWLESLKDRYTWKPSDEQIECLRDAIEHYQTNGYPALKLNELYEQMSKIYKL